MATKQKAAGDAALLKQALLKIERLQSRVDRAERAMHEPIAIIGLGCRLPGGVHDPDRFWDALAAGENLVSETPPDRWHADEFYDPTPGMEGKMYSKAGAFLDDIAGFDPQFFGIAPREAKSLDPQQRLLLEVSWEALENAGQSADALAATATGVFVGIGSTDYQQMQMHQQDLGLLDTYHAAGVAHSVAAGRISYALGLTGPSVAIDTACSSSLVAIHYACLSLRNGECRTALAGGVNVMLAPFSNIAFCQTSMLSPSGRCATFDAGADGFVQGEGCGVIVLKRLTDAIADGDRIDAVIRGTAINQDGASSGLTAPNGPSQEQVIRAALADGGLAPQDVSYVEAHGSGTPLGDPIEVQALGAVLARQRPDDDPLLIGSVKTNTGHLATAAGVAGVIKVVLAMREKQIPPHLHFDSPSPHIPWSSLAVDVPTSLMPWQPSAKTRVAGVSGFGFSGTNVHLILEEPPADDAPGGDAAGTELPLTLSAKSTNALRELAASYANVLAKRSDAGLTDVLGTANAGRSHFKHRLVANAETPADMSAALQDYSLGNSNPAIQAAEVRGPDSPRIAFLFSGIGSEYTGMCRGLLDTEPVFRKAIEQCQDALGERLPVSLVDALQTASMDDERLSYPVLFAMEFALASLWQSWGVKPWAVMGHGAGEYVAACIAGALSLEDGIGLAAERGRLMHSMQRRGSMAVIFASPERVLAALQPHAADAAVAAINGPQQVVVAGEDDALEIICKKLQADGARCLPLSATRALQSPLVDPVLDELEHAASQCEFGKAAIGLVSSLTGETLTAQQLREPSYWRKQARETIVFGKAINTLRDRNVDIFVEIGPDSVLSGLGAQLASQQGGSWLATLRKGENERRQMLSAVSHLYLRGIGIDWAGVFAGRPYRKQVLPTYPFERRRYWIDDLQIASTAAGQESATEHPLLGTRVETPLDTIVYQSDLSIERTPVLFEHVVHGIVVVPAAAILETVIASGSDVLGEDSFDLIDISIAEALVLNPTMPTRVQLLLTSVDERQYSFQLFSQRNKNDTVEWRAHAAGTLVAPRDPQEATRHLDASATAQCETTVDVEELYSGMQARGLHFGEHFHGLSSLSCGDKTAIGNLRAASQPPAGRYRFDPPVLDACIQVVSAALPGFDTHDTSSDIFMPIGIDRVHVTAATGIPACSFAQLRQDAPMSGETLSADLAIAASDGRLLLEFEGLHLKRADANTLMRATMGDIDDLLYRVDWLSVEDASGADGNSRLPAPKSIAAPVEAVLDPLYATHGVAVYERLLPDLDALSTAYIVEALQALGWALEPGNEAQLDTLLEDLQIQNEHRRLLERMLGILEEDGILSRSGDTWTVDRKPADSSGSQMVEGLLQQYADCNAELRWTRNCGNSLADALTGAADAHELLFPRGDMTLATQVYSQTPLAHFFNGLTVEALRAIIAGLPQEQRLNVLEIGAGTGATSAALLEALPADKASYTFTDIGPAFVHQAQRRFSEYEFAEFRVLDIEQDPAKQGFEAGQFNLIVASNVLHATADLRQTVDRVAELLAPGGLLILLEVTAQQRWFDLTVGLTDGWWRFADLDLRPSHPLLTGTEWTQLLEQCGFASSAIVPGAARPAFDQAMILAQKADVQATRAVAHEAATEDWYVFMDESGVGAALIPLLQSSNSRCTIISKGSDYGWTDDTSLVVDPLDPEHFERFVNDRVAGRGTSQHIVYLWPLDASDAELQSVTDLTAAQASICGGALHLTQALAATEVQERRLTIVTRGAQAVGSGQVQAVQSTLWGLNKAITLEHPELLPLAIDLDPSVRATAAEAQQLIDEIRGRADESEIAIRLGCAHVSRLVPTTSGDSEPRDDLSQAAGISKPQSGLLEDLRLAPIERRAPSDDEIEIRVSASSLNFRDVLVALDVHHDFDSIGSECTGRVIRAGKNVTGVQPGDDVVAIAPRSLATHAIANAHLAVRVPDRMRAEDAVTLPIAYLTADYALNTVGRMAAGEVVLIHAAAGGVGMAALQLAQQAGATIIATAGSRRKRHYLRQLGVEHVFSSRDHEFATAAMDITNGRGVDIVLNGLTGEFIEKGLQVLAPGGRFLELGKSDVWEESRALAVNDAIEYHAVDLTTDMIENPQDLRPMLDKLMQHVEDGTLAPLPWQSFPIEKAASAFRFMEQAQHIGKVVLTQSTGDAQNRAEFADDATYLVIGGLSGLGALVADWCVEQGARHLVLAGRREPSAEMLASVSELEAQGARIVIARCDVSQEDDVRQLLADIDAEMPPLRGVFQSAGVLDDGLLLQQKWSRFETVMAPKVQGAWLLHTLTASAPLDFFVMFSSVAAVLGGAGAGNHSAANMYLDALVHSRRNAGLPGLSINWGAWSGTGAAVRQGASQHVASQGLGFIAPAQGLQALHDLMHGDATQTGVLSIDWKVFFERDPAQRKRSLLLEMARATQGTAASTGADPQVAPSAVPDLVAQLEDAYPDKRPALIEAHVVTCAAAILGLEAAAVDPHQPLTEMGLDSLMAVELRNTLRGSIGQQLPATLLFDYPTVEALSRYLGEILLDVEDVPDSPPVADELDLLASIENLSDEEVDRVLGQELD